MRLANADPAPDTIRLPAGTYHLSSVDNVQPEGPVGTPLVISTITIQGDGAGKTIIQRDPGAPALRILQVASNGILMLRDVTIQGGHLDGSASPAASAGGAGILSFGTLVLTNSEVSGNVGELIYGGGGIRSTGDLSIQGSRIEGNRAEESNGGGILSSGTMEIKRSTFRSNWGLIGGAITSSGTGSILDSSFSDNHAMARACALESSGNLTLTGSTIARNGCGSGAVIDVFGGTLRVNNSTIASNGGGVGGDTGGISAAGGTVELRNTILANNTICCDDPFPNGLIPANCHGVVTSLGHNLIGDTRNCSITLLPTDQTGAPGLGAFRDDIKGADGLLAGSGHMPLLAGSAAIDAGEPGSCWPSDQLMGPRTDGNLDGSVICDVGAVEFAPSVKDLLILVLEERTRGRGGKSGPEGSLTIHRRYTNSSGRPIAAPVFVVGNLPTGYLLLSADGAPGGTGARQTANVGPDSVLSPGETMDVRFSIQVPNRDEFKFPVDVVGYPL